MPNPVVILPYDPVRAYRNDRVAYTDNKTDFSDMIIEKAKKSRI